MHRQRVRGYPRFEISSYNVRAAANARGMRCPHVRGDNTVCLSMMSNAASCVRWRRPRDNIGITHGQMGMRRARPNTCKHVRWHNVARFCLTHVLSNIANEYSVLLRPHVNIDITHGPMGMRRARLNTWTPL